MTRTIHRLGTVKINALKTPGYYGDGGGLYLRVRPGGSKSWVFRFTVAGRKRDGGLGRYPALPHKAVPVSKLESGAHLPASELAEAERKLG